MLPALDRGSSGGWLEQLDRTGPYRRASLFRRDGIDETAAILGISPATSGVDGRSRGVVVSRAGASVYAVFDVDN